MKKKAIIKNVITLVFFTIIVLNVLLFFTLKKYTVDTIENKEKLSLPTSDTLSISQWMINYEAYFNNHFPYKYGYIKTINYFKKYRLHSYNSTDKIIFGKNNWLFYNASIYDSLGLNEYAGYRPWTDNQLQKIKTNMEAIERFCNKNNIVFQLLICPSKQTIYSEYLPDNYIKRFDNRYDQLQKLLSQYINIKSALINYKSTHKELLYYKTDTHWNFIAGTITTQKLAQKLSDKFPYVFKFDRFSITDSAVNIGFDLANMMALKNYFSDTTYSILHHEIPTKKIPHVIVVSDSYFEFLEPSFKLLFDTVTTRHLFNDGIPSAELLLKEKPDVFIIELTERYKELLTNDIPSDYF